MRRLLTLLLSALTAALLLPPAPAVAADRTRDGCWTASCGTVDAVRVTSITRAADGRFRLRYTVRRSLPVDVRAVLQFPATYRQPRVDARSVQRRPGSYTLLLKRPPALYGEVHLLLEMRARNHLEQRGWRRLATPDRRTSYRTVTGAEAGAQSVVLTVVGAAFTLTARRGVTAAKLAARAGGVYAGYQAVSDFAESQRATCPGRLAKGQFLRNVQVLRLRQGSSGVVQTQTTTLWHDKASFDRGLAPACSTSRSYGY